MKISNMMLGTVQLGMEYGMANRTGKPSAERAFAILDAVTKGGVNAFDTANSYGDAEEVLGKYFSSPRNTLVDPLIVTKFKIDPADADSAGAVERQIRAQAESSMRRLGISRIPVYMLHQAGDRTRYGAAVSASLRRLKSEGSVGMAGVSVYRTEEADEMLREDLYEAVQIPMSLFDPRMTRSGTLDRLAAAGRLVFVRSVFLQGMFFLDPGDLPEKYRCAAPSLERLRAISRESGVAVAELALAYVRDLPGVTSLVLGCETPEQAEENIRLMACPGLAPEVSARLEALAAEVPIEEIMAAITGKK